MSTRTIPASACDRFRGGVRPLDGAEPLVGPLAGRHSELVLTAAGFHQHAGTLIAYFGQYEYTAEAIRNGIKGGRDHRTRGCGR